MTDVYKKLNGHLKSYLEKGEVTFDIVTNEDGSITMSKNPEILAAYVCYTKKHSPEVYEIMFSGATLSNVIDGVGSPDWPQDPYNLGAEHYKKLPKKDKQKIRCNKIKFIKYWNKYIVPDDLKLEVPTFQDKNSLGEKLDD